MIKTKAEADKVIASLRLDPVLSYISALQDLNLVLAKNTEQAELRVVTGAPKAWKSLTTSRSSTVRGCPPGLAGGIKGAMICHSASVRSLL